jgi:hypothetical protein
MYDCERCGTRFGRLGASESCPRCLARDGVRVALAFRAFEQDGPGRPGGLEEAVRERLARMAPQARGGLRGAA